MAVVGKFKYFIYYINYCCKVLNNEPFPKLKGNCIKLIHFCCDKRRHLHQAKYLFLFIDTNAFQLRNPKSQPWDQRFEKVTLQYTILGISSILENKEQYTILWLKFHYFWRNYLSQKFNSLQFSSFTCWPLDHEVWLLMSGAFLSTNSLSIFLDFQFSFLILLSGIILSFTSSREALEVVNCSAVFMFLSDNCLLLSPVSRVMRSISWDPHFVFCCCWHLR